MNTETREVVRWAVILGFAILVTAVVVTNLKYHFDPEQDCFKRGGVVIKSQRGWHCSEQAK